MIKFKLKKMNFGFIIVGKMTTITNKRIIRISNRTFEYLNIQNCGSVSINNCIIEELHINNVQQAKIEKSKIENTIIQNCSYFKSKIMTAKDIKYYKMNELIIKFQGDSIDMIEPDMNFIMKYDVDIEIDDNIITGTTLKHLDLKNKPNFLELKFSQYQGIIKNGQYSHITLDAINLTGNRIDIQDELETLFMDEKISKLKAKKIRSLCIDNLDFNKAKQFSKLIKKSNELLVSNATPIKVLHKFPEYVAHNVVKPPLTGKHKEVMDGIIMARNRAY